ncbi:DUF6212 domain-containing protein [Microvirga calopogonii]|uniref:DUF6212 domain-containing protein n=1 Tax=Microvirga calopogonii TaxID=2078013 RepID=UPI000E0DC8DE|nr:DUF6212 domain-containing protein [Microvirga calopogonii]
MMALTANTTTPFAQSPRADGLLKGPVLFVIKVHRDRIPSTLLSTGHVFWFQGTDGEAATLVDVNGNRFNVRDTPPCTLAILADPSAPEGERGQLLDWLRRRGLQHQPALIEWDAGQQSSAMARLVEELIKLLVTSAHRTVEANRELLKLRMFNADLQDNFAAVESYMQLQGLQPFDLAFSNEPLSNPSQPNVLAHSSPEGISQILPVASTAVSAIAIHFERLDPHPEAELRADLVSLEDRCTIDSWIVPLSNLDVGWNFLGLTRTLGGIPRSLEVRLQVTGMDGEPPLLSLGGLQPVDMFQVRDADTERPLVKNSIALQIWCGLPGVSLPTWANYFPAHSEQGSTPGFREVSLSPGTLDLASHANCDEISFEFPAILALPQERAVACHPPETGMTIGMLPTVCPPAARRVSASASISNEKSNDVDFAIVVANDLARTRELLEEKRAPSAGEAFSGWSRVANTDTVRVSAFVSEQVASPQSIYIATRMTTPGVNSFAWAKFRDFSILVDR